MITFLKARVSTEFRGVLTSKWGMRGSGLGRVKRSFRDTSNFFSIKLAVAQLEFFCNSLSFISLQHLTEII